MPKAAKRRRAIAIPEKNASKYFSYREAWMRIKLARIHGFYFEAVTLEESIISDRLISHLSYVGAIKSNEPIERYSFGRLLGVWKKRVSEPIPTKHFPDLCSAIDEWRKRRNKIVHGIVKSRPSDERVDVLDFLKEADVVALQGESLARSITDWCKKWKREQHPEPRVQGDAANP